MRVSGSAALCRRIPSCTRIRKQYRRFGQNSASYDRSDFGSNREAGNKLIPLIPFSWGMQHIRENIETGTENRLLPPQTQGIM